MPWSALIAAASSIAAAEAQRDAMQAAMSYQAGMYNAHLGSIAQIVGPPCPPEIRQAMLAKLAADDALRVAQEREDWFQRREIYEAQQRAGMQNVGMHHDLLNHSISVLYGHSVVKPSLPQPSKDADELADALADFDRDMAHARAINDRAIAHAMRRKTKAPPSWRELLDALIEWLYIQARRPPHA